MISESCCFASVLIAYLADPRSDVVLVLLDLSLKSEPFSRVSFRSREIIENVSVCFRLRPQSLLAVTAWFASIHDLQGLRSLAPDYLTRLETRADMRCNVQAWQDCTIGWKCKPGNHQVESQLQVELMEQASVKLEITTQAMRRAEEIGEVPAKLLIALSLPTHCCVSCTDSLSLWHLLRIPGSALSKSITCSIQQPIGLWAGLVANIPTKRLQLGRRVLADLAL